MSPLSLPPLSPSLSYILTSFIDVESLRQIFSAMGAVDVIVGKMSEYKTSSDVQLYACWALLELLSSSDDGKLVCMHV